MTSGMVIISTLVITFLIGVYYALLIARRPFPAGLTWLSVVIGCSFTNAAISVVLWELTHDLAAALVPWGCYALTGIPMILGQILKDHRNHREADEFFEEIHRND